MQNKVETVAIWSGHLGTSQTLQLMRKMVLESTKSPKIVNIATRLWMTAKQTRKNPAQLVDDFLRKSFVYTDENIETLQAPDYMLNGLEMSGVLRGDCDDITTLHASLLNAMGIPVRFVAIRSTFEDPNFDHVYLEAQDVDEWTAYDVTIPLGTNIHWFGRQTMQV